MLLGPLDILDICNLILTVVHGNMSGHQMHHLSLSHRIFFAVVSFGFQYCCNIFKDFGLFN